MLLHSSAYYGLFLKFVSFFGRRNMMTFVINVDVSRSKGSFLLKFG